MLEKDLSVLIKEPNFIEWLIKKISLKFYLNRRYNFFEKQYVKISSRLTLFLNLIKDDRKEILKFLDFAETFKTKHKNLSNLTQQMKSAKHELMQLDLPEYKIEEMTKLKNKRIELSRNIIENYWTNKIASITPKDELHLKRYLDATQKLESYIGDKKLYSTLLAEQQSEMSKIIPFFPVWAVTNLSVKNSLPLKNNLFDLLIIDEASQNDIASTIPLFYRAKRIVIIGDPKQLKHVSILKDSEDKELAAKNKVSKLYLDFSYAKNSIYDLAERCIKLQNKSPKLLNEHYRSNRDIIEFSNIYFYNRMLQVKAAYSGFGRNKQRAIRLEPIEGNTISEASPYNKPEAEMAVEILKTYSKSEFKNFSFGVVTLFRKQTELIRNKVNEINSLREMDITVGTAHAFQGDEKDIIIFSPVISNGVKEKTVRWVNDVNPNLINVAVTRARKIFVIVGDKEKCSQYEGPLKNLVRYAEENEMSAEFDSDIEERLFNELEKNGIYVTPQFNVIISGKKTYRLDFALFVKDSKYDIEIDGDKAHSQKIEEDILRDKHLRLENWKIRRFRAVKIQQNTKDVIEEIKRLY